MRNLLSWKGLLLALAVGFLFNTPEALAGEAKLRLPAELRTEALFFGMTGHTLLLWGLVVCFLGLLFGVAIYAQLRSLPVHKVMLEVSELIYATCKTYLITQAKFLMVLWVFITAAIVFYFGFLAEYPTGVIVDGVEQTQIGFPAWKVGVIVLFSLIGMAGSALVAWFGIRVNTFANSRTAHASLRGYGYPCYAIPLKAGMSIGMVLISVELVIMLAIILFIDPKLAGPCFIGFAIGESLGAAALRVAGGIFTKIADIGSDLMKIVFRIKEDDARNPGVIADCVGDNAGDSVGPSADGFETYGVTGVALITFILLAITDPLIQTKLLVWIFVMRLLMVVTSGLAYFVNEAIAKARYGSARSFNFEAPLTTLVWLASILSILGTYVVSYLMMGSITVNGVTNTDLWWKLATIITCGTLAGAIIPEVTKIFTSVHARHTREVVTASKEGGASLNILSGLTAGNFSGFWVGGATICGLMAVAYAISTIGGNVTGLASIMPAAAIFAFGLVAFGFLGMGPVTIAVDSYGPVTDNAQSIYELSLIEEQPDIKNDLKQNFGIDADFSQAKALLEENDGAGNTFKATAKPVLIGTAVVGATTMVFSIIMLLTEGLTNAAAIANLSILHAPFLLGIIVGAAVIYWFSGASCQAVITGAYRAVEFIRRNIRLEGTSKASEKDSKRVVEICTQYAQSGMFNIFLTVFFMTLATAFTEPYFFVGFLIGLAVVGLFQAIFMANAGGAWDNAKKIVETELRKKGTDLHAATVVGDTVGDPFKDTSSVALNPIIKFSTLFGLLAVELALQLTRSGKSTLQHVLAAAFFVVALFFVYRSFYAMRIGDETHTISESGGAGMAHAPTLERTHEPAGTH
ncbi:MAG: sodium-translocating pyrophosphatase [Phycisphaerae bacterium]|nr:sodium-translocating pyrophosphatase [Phycisphaerae bacterium]MDW8262910.1 sodium-translocating pyrophosphatase [Phycisphaerales bacterium]